MLFSQISKQIEQSPKLEGEQEERAKETSRKKELSEKMGGREERGKETEMRKGERKAKKAYR